MQIQLVIVKNKTKKTPKNRHLFLLYFVFEKYFQCYFSFVFGHYDDHALESLVFGHECVHSSMKRVGVGGSILFYYLFMHHIYYYFVFNIFLKYDLTISG